MCIGRTPNRHASKQANQRCALDLPSKEGGGGGKGARPSRGVLVSVSVAQLSNLEAPEHADTPPVPTEQHGRGFARQAHEAREKRDAGASQELGRKLSLHEWDAHTWGEKTGGVRINTRQVYRNSRRIAAGVKRPAVE